MSDYVINLIVNVFLMIVATIPILTIIYNKTIEGNIWKKIGWRGGVIIACVIGIVAFNFIRDFNQDRKQELADKAQNKSDSLLIASQNELIEYQILTNDLLNEKVDVVNPQLKIRQLSKGLHPPAFFKKDGEMKGFNIQFVSIGGTCYNVMLNCYFFIDKDPYYKLLDSSTVVLGESFITDEIVATRSIDIPPEILNYTRILIFLTGSFSKDPLGKHIIPYNEALLYNFKDKEFIGISDTKFRKFKDYIKSYY